VSDPDENVSQELFQLFTIGLTKINMGGSKKLDKDGRKIRT